MKSSRPHLTSWRGRRKNTGQGGNGGKGGRLEEGGKLTWNDLKEVCAEEVRVVCGARGGHQAHLEACGSGRVTPVDEHALLVGGTEGTADPGAGITPEGGGRGRGEGERVIHRGAPSTRVLLPACRLAVLPVPPTHTKTRPYLKLIMLLSTAASRELKLSPAPSTRRSRNTRAAS